MTSSSSDVKLHPSWMAQVGGEFDEPYMRSLKQFLQAEKKAHKVIFPPGDKIFNALNTTPFDKVKVVIIGQDPYHGPGQAHGLCFSVQPGVALPPSLKNIFKEIQQDLGISMPANGCLQTWAERGVLLLNATLTVEQGRAGSHQNQGWERFTDAIIAALNNHRERLVFILWGGYAQRKGAFIDTARHCVLQSPHPSPLSVHRGFYGCRHFSKANSYLEANGIAPIDWSLPVD